MRRNLAANVDALNFGNQPHLLDRGREVIRAEAEALMQLADTLTEDFEQACLTISRTRRQLAVTGLGKSGHIARKVAATFSATGTPAIFIHPTEAGHGDLGALNEGDVLLVFSNSGNTAELRVVLNFARNLKIPIIGISSRRNSLVIELADVPLLLPNVKEACPVNIAPTTSSAMQLALGDALAMAVMDFRGITKNRLRTLHPAGMIGLTLTPTSDLMHGAERMPLVSKTALIPEVISIMTSGCFGLAGVTDSTGALVGVITDGDLRRHFDALTRALAHEIMTPTVKTIASDLPAGEALVFLNDNQITAAFVVADPTDSLQVPLGIIHIHDLLRHGLN